VGGVEGQEGPSPARDLAGPGRAPQSRWARLASAVLQCCAVLWSVLHPAVAWAGGLCCGEQSARPANEVVHLRAPSTHPVGGAAAMASVAAAAAPIVPSR